MRTVSGLSVQDFFGRFIGIVMRRIEIIGIVRQTNAERRILESDLGGRLPGCEPSESAARVCQPASRY